jgi:hypothetical protein
MNGREEEQESRRAGEQERNGGSAGEKKGRRGRKEDRKRGRHERGRDGGDRERTEGAAFSRAGPPPLLAFVLLLSCSLLSRSPALLFFCSSDKLARDSLTSVR